MSWGERSCKHFGKCPIPDRCKMSTCNVDCPRYVWDEKTKQDSVRKGIQPATGPTIMFGGKRLNRTERRRFMRKQNMRGGKR